MSTRVYRSRSRAPDQSRELLPRPIIYLNLVSGQFGLPCRAVKLELIDCIRQEGVTWRGERKVAGGLLLLDIHAVKGPPRRQSIQRLFESAPLSREWNFQTVQISFLSSLLDYQISVYIYIYI